MSGASRAGLLPLPLVVARHPVVKELGNLQAARPRGRNWDDGRRYLLRHVVPPHDTEHRARQVQRAVTKLRRPVPVLEASGGGWVHRGMDGWMEVKAKVDKNRKKMGINQGNPFTTLQRAEYGLARGNEHRGEHEQGQIKHAADAHQLEMRLRLGLRMRMRLRLAREQENIEEHGPRAGESAAATKHRRSFLNFRLHVFTDEEQFSHSQDYAPNHRTSGSPVLLARVCLDFLCDGVDVRGEHLVLLSLVERLQNHGQGFFVRCPVRVRAREVSERACVCTNEVRRLCFRDAERQVPWKNPMLSSISAINCTYSPVSKHGRVRARVPECDPVPRFL